LAAARGRILVLNIEHLLVNFFCGHAAAEKAGSCEVAPVTRISSAHHVLGIEHLLRELWHRQRAVLLRTARGQRREASHKEVKARERDQIHGNLPQVAVELTRETQAAGDTGHRRADEVIQITVGGRSELKSPKADVVQSFVIKKEALVGILDKLVERQHRVVGLDNGVRNFGRRNHRKCFHNSIRVLLANLADEKGAHARASAAAKGVAHLETLEAVATLCLLAHDIKDGIDELSPLCVVSLGPIISSARLTKNKIVWPEKLTERSSADAIHGAWLQVHEDRAWYVPTSGGFVEVDIDPFQLQVGITMVRSRGVDSVLIADHFPELSANLVTALAGLDVHEFTHGFWRSKCAKGAL
jgi:hypothetical protein